MNSDQIREMINAAVGHEERTGKLESLLSEHLARNQVSLTARQKSDCLAFVREYIRETPDIMKRRKGSHLKYSLFTHLIHHAYIPLTFE